MSNQSNPADDIPPNVLAPRPIDYAHRYWNNARQIGDPGSPDMVAGRDIQMQHAHMAMTAALISIADSLDQMQSAGRVNARRLQILAVGMDRLSKELTKIRYSVKA